MTNALTLTWLHDSLQSLPDREQLPQMLQRIAHQTGSSTVLFNSVGEVLAAAGPAPTRLIWEAVDARFHPATATVAAKGEGQEQPMRVGRWFLHPVTTGPQSTQHILVLASRDQRSITGETLQIASTAVTAVLAALQGLDSIRTRERATLLATLEQGIPRDRETRFWPRLVDFGFVAHAPFLLIVATPSARQANPHRARDLVRRVGGERVGILFASHLVTAASDDEFHALLADTPAARQWLNELARDHFVGISASHSILTDVPRALREATLAHAVAADFGVALWEHAADELTVGNQIHYVDLPLRRWLTATVGRSELTSRRRRILRSFDHQADLLETLTVYLACNMEVSAAAAHLFVHSNTVRYRLGKIESALGESLKSPELVTDLMLCLEPRVAAARKQLQFG